MIEAPGFTIEDIVFEDVTVRATGLDILLKYLEEEGFFPDRIVLQSEDKLSKVVVTDSPHPGMRYYVLKGEDERVAMQGMIE